MSEPPAPTHPTPPWWALAAGGAVMAYAVIGAFRDLGDGFVGWGSWVVGADLVHDALVAPVVCGVGWLIARTVPAGRIRAAVQAGLLASGGVLVVAWVPLVGLGGNPKNPTIRPLDYTTATLTSLGLVWAVVLLIATVGWRRGGGRSPERSQDR